MAPTSSDMLLSLSYGACELWKIDSSWARTYLPLLFQNFDGERSDLAQCSLFVGATEQSPDFTDEWDGWNELVDQWNEYCAINLPSKHCSFPTGILSLLMTPRI